MNEHPDLELLKHYLNNIDSDEFSTVRLHLASCADCRNLLDGLVNLQALSAHELNDSLTEQDHENISNYINDLSDTADSQSCKDFIDNNPQAFKAALHYASQQSALQKHRSPDKSRPESSFTDKLSGTGFIDSVRSLLTIQTPAWFSIPVTAAFIALIGINLLNTTPSALQHTIVSYQDNAIIQFRSKEQIPGIGFFAQNEVKTRTYDGLDVSVTSDGQFTLSWPAIENALRYDLQLHMYNNGNRISVAEITTENNTVSFQSNIDSMNHRYEWQLTGETRDHLLFQASGGFVISEVDRGSSQ